MIDHHNQQSVGLSKRAGYAAFVIDLAKALKKWQAPQHFTGMRHGGHIPAGEKRIDRVCVDGTSWSGAAIAEVVFLLFMFFFKDEKANPTPVAM